MFLSAHSDAAYLNVTKARSRDGAHIMLSENVPVTAYNGPILVIAQIIRMSCRQPLKPNWQAFSSSPKKWSLSGKLSTKWAGHSQNHPFGVKIQLTWEWPIKTLFHEKPSRWTCNSTGFAAETHKTSSDTSGIQDP